MTNDEEWDRRIERGRNRFLVPTYTIKNQYSQPGTPFLVKAFYIGAPSTPQVMPKGAHDNPGELRENGYERQQLQ